MYGFIGCFGYNKMQLYAEKHTEVEVITDELSCENFSLKRVTLNKFANDKVCYESDDVIIVIEGVIYNFFELQKQYGEINRGKLLETLYKMYSVLELTNMLNGYFSGIIYDKKFERISLITDHISYRPIWYYKKDDVFVFSTDIDWLYITLKKNNIVLQLDNDGAFCLLNYGYILGDITIIKGIKKLLAGKVLEYDKNNLNILEYYTIPDPSRAKEYKKSEYNNILISIDAAFENAVKRAYLKDDEYGYNHILTLSGGLDSRLVLLAACKLGYKTLCVTMGESNCQDIKISSDICNDFKLEHIVYELNNGLFLNDIDKAIEANGGNIYWLGFAHSFRLISLVSFTNNNLGCVHSGDMGDSILGGSLFSQDSKKIIDLTEAMYASTYIDGFSDDFKALEKKRYADQFRYNHYNRGLNSAGNGCYAVQYFSECSSPFIDKDLMKIIFTIPYDLMKNHKLYNLYMENFFPNAINYNWERTGCKPNASKFTKYIVKWKHRFQFHILRKSMSMNPFEKWYRNNKDLKNYFEYIYNSGISIIENSTNEILKKAIKTRFDSKSIIDKSLAIMLIRTIQIYGIEI